MFQPKRLGKLLDKVYGISHGRRTYFGRISTADQLLYIGLNLGSSMLRISEEDKTILVLKKCQHGSFKLKCGRYKAIARVDLRSPMQSRFDEAPKAVRAEIINYMSASKAEHSPPRTSQH